MSISKRKVLTNLTIIVINNKQKASINDWGFFLPHAKITILYFANLRYAIMKKPILILLIVVSFIALFMLAFVGLSKHIFNYVSCEQFNIDNIELRTGIDIPSVQTGEIQCTCTDSTKVSSFKLDLEKVQLADYLDRNGFKASEDLFIKSNKTDKTDWHAQYDPEENILSFDIKYHRSKD